MRNIFKSAAIASLLTGLVVLVGMIAVAKPAFASGNEVVSNNVVETTNPFAFLGQFKSSNPAPTPGAVVLFGMGSVLVFTTQRKFAKA